MSCINNGDIRVRGCLAQHIFGDFDTAQLQRVADADHPCVKRTVPVTQMKTLMKKTLTNGVVGPYKSVQSA